MNTQQPSNEDSRMDKATFKEMENNVLHLLRTNLELNEQKKMSLPPTEKMLEIMSIYGPEEELSTIDLRMVTCNSDDYIPQIFRFMNPTFHERFQLLPSGDWVPCLGKEKELYRRLHREDGEPSDITARRGLQALLPGGKQLLIWYNN